MVINSTNINKRFNHLSSNESLNSMVINSTNINKRFNHLSSNESLNSDGHQFHQYKQKVQSPLMVINSTNIHGMSNKTAMVINSTNINKRFNHLSSNESLNSDGHQFHQYKQKVQSPLVINSTNNGMSNKQRWSSIPPI